MIVKVAKAVSRARLLRSYVPISIRRKKKEQHDPANHNGKTGEIEKFLANDVVHDCRDTHPHDLDLRCSAQTLWRVTIRNRALVRKGL